MVIVRAGLGITGAMIIGNIVGSFLPAMMQTFIAAKYIALVGNHRTYSILVMICLAFLILIDFTYYVFNLLSTGKIYLFLNPRMVKCIYLSFAIFLLLTIFQFRRFFIAAQNSKRKISFCIFLVPLFLGIYINTQGLNTEVATKKGIAVTESNIGKRSFIFINFSFTS